MLFSIVAVPNYIPTSSAGVFPGMLLITVSIPGMLLITVSIPGMLLITVSIPGMLLITVSIPGMLLITVSIPGMLLITVSGPGLHTYSPPQWWRLVFLGKPAGPQLPNVGCQGRAWMGPGRQGDGEMNSGNLLSTGLVLPRVLPWMNCLFPGLLQGRLGVALLVIIWGAGKGQPHSQAG